jgi:hypothetical protein
VLLDQYGRPTPIKEESNHFLRGGWVETPGLLPGDMSFRGDIQRQYTINRQLERRKARLFFYFNYMIAGALDVSHGFLIGDAFNYGEINDKNVDIVCKEFWDANEFMDMLERYFYEYHVDGENMTIFPLKKDDPGKNQPAIINFPDVDYGVYLTYNTSTRKIEKARVEGIDSEFDITNSVWTAHKAFWNDPRGLPVIMQAVDSGIAYINLLNHRIRMHDIQSRINGVYKAFVPNGLETLKAKALLDSKSLRFNSIPRNGAVLTLAKDPATGMSEEFDFNNPVGGSSDSETDAKLFALGVCIALNIPLYWLFSGTDVNTKASAVTISEAAKRVLLKKQAKIRTWLNKVFRIEIIRRLGNDYRVKVKVRKINKAGKIVSSTEYIPVTQYELPWQFPNLDVRDVSQTVNKLKFAISEGLVSKPTSSTELGYDYEREQEMIAALGELDDTTTVPVDNTTPPVGSNIKGGK